MSSIVRNIRKLRCSDRSVIWLWLAIFFLCNVTWAVATCAYPQTPRAVLVVLAVAMTLSGAQSGSMLYDYFFGDGGGGGLRTGFGASKRGVGSEFRAKWSVIDQVAGCGGVTSDHASWLEPFEPHRCLAPGRPIEGRAFRFLPQATRYYNVPADKLRCLIEKGVEPAEAVRRVNASAAGRG